MARPAAAACDDTHPVLDLPCIADHILVVFTHPERTPVAAGDAGGHTLAGRSRLKRGLLTRKKSRHVTSPNLSHTASIADCVHLCQEKGRFEERHVHVIRSTLYNVWGRQKITRKAISHQTSAIRRQLYAPYKHDVLFQGLMSGERNLSRLMAIIRPRAIRVHDAKLMGTIASSQGIVSPQGTS